MSRARDIADVIGVKLTSPIVQTDSIKDDSGTRELASDSGSAWSWGSWLPSGSIVQVQHTQYGDSSGESGYMSTLTYNTNYVVQASGNSSDNTVTGILSVNITPRIYGSKIWLQCHWFGELSTDNAYDSVFFFWRNTTKLASAVDANLEGEKGISMATQTYKGDADAASTPEILFMQYFDTHGQSQSDVNSGTQITYKLGFVTHNSGVTQLATNKSILGTHEVGVSSICAIELAP